MAGGPKVPAEPVARHLDLVDNLTDFAQRSGVNVSTLANIRKGTNHQVTTTIAVAILATPTPGRPGINYVKHVEPTPEWMHRAACNGVDPDLFFPGRGAGDADIQAAKAFCRGCPVRLQCLDYALTNRETAGIWGGLSERERRLVRKQRRLSA